MEEVWEGMDKKLLKKGRHGTVLQGRATYNSCMTEPLRTKRGNFVLASAAAGGSNSCWG